MIPLENYWKTKFMGKEVLVNISDLRQVKGTLEKIYSDGILLMPKGKKTPISIPIRSILTMEEIE